MRFFIIFCYTRAHPINERVWSEWSSCSNSCTGGLKCRIYVDRFGFDAPECQPCEKSISPDCTFENRLDEISDEFARSSLPSRVSGNPNDVSSGRLIESLGVEKRPLTFQIWGSWHEWGPCCPTDQWNAKQARTRTCFDDMIGGSLCLPQDKFQTRECKIPWSSFSPERSRRSSEIWDFLPLNPAHIWGAETREIPTQQPKTVLITTSTETTTITTRITTTLRTTLYSPAFSSRPYNFSTTSTNQTNGGIARDSSRSNETGIKKQTIFSQKCPNWKGPLNLAIFDNVSKEDLFTPWGTWGECDKVSGRKLRIRKCQDISGIDTFCDPGDLIDSIGCVNENARTSTFDGPDTDITVFDLSYCERDYSRYLRFMAQLCLERSRCMIFRRWSDEKLRWLINCFPTWGFNTFNEKTLKMRAKYIRINPSQLIN